MTCNKVFHGLTSWNFVCSWKVIPAPRRTWSIKAGAMSWSPMGIPLSPNPHGMLNAGIPAKICRDGVDVQEIDTQRVINHFIKTEGGHRNGWACNDVADLEGLSGNHRQ